MTFAGCVLVTGIVAGDGKITVSGVLFGLGSGFGYALYSIFSRFAIERGYSTFTITFYTFLIATLSSLFFTNPMKVFSVAVGSGKNILFSLVLGIAGTVIPYLAYTKGLKNMENGKASIIASIEPVTASILGLFIYHENLSISAWIGAAMVLGALVICNVRIHSKES